MLMYDRLWVPNAGRDTVTQAPESRENENGKGFGESVTRLLDVAAGGGFSASASWRCLLPLFRS